MGMGVPFVFLELCAEALDKDEKVRERNAQVGVEKFYAVVQDTVETEDGLKWLAFGPGNPSYVKNPVAGDM